MFTSSYWLIDKARRWQLYSDGGRWVGGTLTLNARGLQVNKACIAVARELAGFIWAIGMQAQREHGQAN